MHMKENTLITISRQYGSGGREVSKIVAKKLGIRSYDRKIVSMAAKQLDSGEPLDDIIEKSYQTPDSDIASLGDFAFERRPMHNQMFIEQAKVMLEIAKKGSAVFLGRCADWVLKEHPNTFKFFIYADDEFKTNRAKDHYGNNTLKELEKEDENRKRYYAYYTGETWGDPQNYDLMINTSHLSLEKAADLIIEYINIAQNKAE